MQIPGTESTTETEGPTESWTDRATESSKFYHTNTCNLTRFASRKSKLNLL